MVGLVIVFMMLLICSGLCRAIAQTRDFRGKPQISKDSAQMDERIAFLADNSNNSVIVHVHIPKACGTALSMALSSDCRCMMYRGIPNCYNCKYIVSASGKRIPYSISRSTGWKAGVHPPYSVMKRLMPSILGDFSSEHITPVYVIMLRSPFERFISEIKNWGGSKGQAVDWSIVNYKKNGTIYLEGTNSTFLPTHKNESQSDFRRRLYLYASLSSKMIYHNRHVKMIGGNVANFDMQFSNARQLGSRWRSDESTGIFSRAQYVLSKEPSVIIGLEERFTEMMCTLEVIYGDKYKFWWDPISNTHGHGRKTFTMQTLASRNMAQYPEVYSEWGKRNKEDVELYSAAELNFELQFQAVLRYLKRKTKKFSADLASTAPHCVPFMK